MKLNATDFDGFKKKRKKLLKMRKRRISITFLSLIISIQATLISFKKKNEKPLFRVKSQQSSWIFCHNFALRIDKKKLHLIVKALVSFHIIAN